MRRLSPLAALLLAILSLASCRRSRIHDHPEWASVYKAYGINDAAIIIREHTHEAIHYYNQDGCTEPLPPASTFKIFNSLVALETGVAPDERLLIRWDSVVRSRPEWNQDLTLRDAFRASSPSHFQEVARRIGPADMKKALDTVQYGNRTISRIDSFWLDGSLRISADEQVGLMKKLYFHELPFSERSQRIVRSMMLWEDSTGHRLYYKTGWYQPPAGPQVLWVVGASERIEKVKEQKGAMNESDIRMYPYFFAQVIKIPAGDTSKDWGKLRIDALKAVLRKMEAI